MWEDVIIGKGNIGVTTTKCWFHKNPDWCDLSSNSVGYRVSMPRIIDVGGMTIFKGTREGNKITTLLSSKQEQKLNAYLLKLFFSKANPQLIINLIQRANAEGIREGMQLKQLELQRVLGL